MEPRIFYQEDCNLSALEGHKIAIIGYGSQGHAHALNLHDSGVKVIVGLYEGSKSKERAEKAGLTVMTVPEAVKAADIVMILIPDEPGRYVQKGYRPLHDRGQGFGLRSWLQYPLWPNRPREEHRRVYDRSQGSGAHRPQRIYGGQGNAGFGSCVPGLHRPLP